MEIAPIDPASEQWLGRTLAGRYRLERFLGSGGAGSVYDAAQDDLGRRVAIKVLKPELAKSPPHLERFRREARAIARLGHPNIATLIDFVEARPPEPAFLVLELVEGESLFALVTREGRLAPARAVSIACGVLAGLEAAHGEGIVHRDLKLGNVVVTDVPGVGEVAKLLDFGLAQIYSDPSLARLTERGFVVGTPRYMAPEQATGRDVDARADVFSLGIILYRMLAGVFPFEGRLREVQQEIVATPTPPIPASAGVPRELADVVMRALAKDRDERWPSAAAMADALRAALARETPLDVTARAVPRVSGADPTASEPAVSQIPTERPPARPLEPTMPMSAVPRTQVSPVPLATVPSAPIPIQPVRRSGLRWALAIAFAIFLALLIGAIVIALLFGAWLTWISGVLL